MELPLWRYGLCPQPVTLQRDSRWGPTVVGQGFVPSPGTAASQPLDRAAVERPFCDSPGQHGTLCRPPSIFPPDQGFFMVASGWIAKAFKQRVWAGFYPC